MVKGYEFLTSSGAVGIKKTGGWILEAEPTDSADFDGQISALLGSINISLDDWASVRGRFEINIFAGGSCANPLRESQFRPNITNARQP
jgi:hypothetical protein